MNVHTVLVRLVHHNLHPADVVENVDVEMEINVAVDRNVLAAAIKVDSVNIQISFSNLLIKRGWKF